LGDFIHGVILLVIVTVLGNGAADAGFAISGPAGYTVKYSHSSASSAAPSSTVMARVDSGFVSRPTTRLVVAGTSLPAAESSRGLISSSAPVHCPVTELTKRANSTRCSPTSNR